jgi:hypothetical protein
VRRRERDKASEQPLRIRPEQAVACHDEPGYGKADDGDDGKDERAVERFHDASSLVMATGEACSESGFGSCDTTPAAPGAYMFEIDDHSALADWGHVIALEQKVWGA